MKLKEKIRATRLRKLGKSYSEIQKNVKVSRSTLSLWLRDIELTNKQKERLYITLPQKHAYRLAKRKQRERIKNTKQIVTKAEKETQELIKNPLFLAGLMLYWAEGDKTQEAVKFTNSDPVMIALAMKWFREICKVPEDKFRVCIHAHSLHCLKHIENYWSKITNIPTDQFYKTFIKKTSLRHRKNPLYNGTCAIVINSVALFRKIKGWRKGFLKELGIKKDALVA